MNAFEIVIFCRKQALLSLCFICKVYSTSNKDYLLYCNIEVFNKL